MVNYNLSLISNNINSKEKEKEICHNEEISIIMLDNSKPQTLLDNDSIFKSNNNNIEKSNRQTALCNDSTIFKSNNNENNDLTSITTARDNKSSYLIPENQINLNTELKGSDNVNMHSISFKDMIIEEQNNSINLINNKKKRNEFNIKYLEIKNEILLNIINEAKKDEDEKKSVGENTEQNNIEEENKKIEYENIIKNRNINLKIESNENISLLQEKKNINNNYNEKTFICDNDKIIIKGINKEKIDKMTEISDELNKIEPHNHSELIFKGIINKKDTIENKNNVDIKNNNDAMKANGNENNNKVILKTNQEFNFINNKKPEKDVENKKINYNEVNEIEMGDCLEINPYEMKRTKNNENNIFISYENNMQMINKCNTVFNEKAKKNMMKIILPVRIKSVLKNWVKKNVYKLLINNLRKISFITHLIIINNSYNQKSKKIGFEKMKDNLLMIKCKKYIMKELGKNKIKNVFKKYAIYKWKIILIEFAKFMISNKTLIKNNNK